MYKLLDSEIRKCPYIDESQRITNSLTKDVLYIFPALVRSVRIFLVLQLVPSVFLR